jgi:hypothetical protein
VVPPAPLQRQLAKQSARLRAGVIK